ncbi:MAG: hypothetical protein IJR54_07845 [Oscillibacter sp.]|nr:hypothetical protein [Oscillibacter sp.]
MTKYLLAFVLSYVAALSLFAVMGMVSLFHWPVGPVPVGFSLLWTLLPPAVTCLLGHAFARRWSVAAHGRELAILFAAMAFLFLLGWFVEALQPLSAPGQALSRPLGLSAPGVLTFFTGLLGTLLFPALFHLGWRL